VFSCRDYRACAVAILVIVGCDNQKDDASAERIKAMAGGELKAVVPVSGKVLVDGQPTGGVTVTLYSELGGTSAGESQTKTDGTYCFQTYGECDGIAPGKYRVAFRLMPKQRKNDNFSPADDRFKGKYSDPRRSQFKLTVEAGAPQTNVDYDLQTKK